MKADWTSPDGTIRLWNRDNREVLESLSPNTIASTVTDPPYGLSFMGKHWDYDVPCRDVWALVMTAMKPGAHLLSFFGTRTYHRGVVNIEDAGFEIRDQMGWMYGSGFPKSLDVSKAIDKAAGAENVIGEKPDRWTGKGNSLNFSTDRPQATCKITAPATEAARQWNGWGTALKPAQEPIVLARKPLAGTVAANVLAHGSGALNIDACRVAHDEECRVLPPSQANIDNPSEKHRQAGRRTEVLELKPNGRWPANIIHDGSDEVLAVFPETGISSGGSGEASQNFTSKNGIYGEFAPMQRANAGGLGDEGSAARFFYCAKADKADRGKGNNHPTVKPTDLMRYLVRLVTPIGGIVIDPYMGSGSTGIAAYREYCGFIGIEREPKYFDIAVRRIEAELRQPRLFPALTPKETQGDLFAESAQ